MFSNLRLSLRTAIFIVFFISSSITALAVLYIQFYREDDTLNVMSERIINTRGEAVGNALNYYVNIPRQANALVSVFTRTLDADDRLKALHQIGDYLYTSMDLVFSSESLLSSIAFGSVEGDYIGFSRNLETNQISLIQKSPETRGRLVFYRDGNSHSPVVYVVDDYDLFERPWFRSVHQTRSSMWSRAYRDVNSESGISISFSSPVSDHQGRYIGVISSDLRISQLNRFLANLTTAEHSLIYLVNDKGQMIAASAAGMLNGQKKQGLAHQEGEDLPFVADSTVPEVRATAEYLQSGEEGAINRIDVQGIRYFSKVIPIGNAQSLQGWRVVVLVSENELMGELSGYRNMTIAIAVLVFLTGCLLSLRILSVVVKPLKKIAEQAPEIARRRKIEYHQDGAFNEINMLGSALRRMAGDLDTAFAQLEDQINIDSETGMLTRTGLISQLGGETTLFCGAIGAVNLSSVQPMINNLGSSYASRYIQTFISFLRQHLPANALIARDAVDRLLICCPCRTGTQREVQTLRLMNLIQEVESEYENRRFVFMGHMGVCVADGSQTLDTALGNAGIAMQAARQREDVGALLYDESLREQATRNITLLNHLYGAIPARELYLVYQPIVSLNDTRIKEAECLVRWHNSELGMVRPDLFIRVAEESGYIVQLGRWIIAQACQELQEQITQGLCGRDFKLHINVSIIELVQPDFYDYLLERIAACGLVTSNICIEVTETSMIKGDRPLQETLSRLRVAGVTVSIDDFGSGFSSLSYLHRLEFDALKIDRNFVMDVIDNKKNESIISAVILLADSGFHVPLIAEGVETLEVVEKLRAMGCEKAQGYYFCRPLRFNEWPQQILSRVLERTHEDAEAEALRI